jgi:hypothetical protein
VNALGYYSTSTNYASVSTCTWAVITAAVFVSPNVLGRIYNGVSTLTSIAGTFTTYTLTRTGGSEGTYTLSGQTGSTVTDATTGLTNNTPYTFTLTPVNALGYSSTAFTNITGSTTAGIIYTLASATMAPTLVNASGTTTSVYMTWTNTGYSSIRVQNTTSSGTVAIYTAASGTVLYNSNGKDTLSTNTQYTYTFTAVNGDGAYLVGTTSTTLATCTWASAPTLTYNNAGCSTTQISFTYSGGTFTSLSIQTTLGTQITTITSSPYTSPVNGLSANSGNITYFACPVNQLGYYSTSTNYASVIVGTWASVTLASATAASSTQINVSCSGTFPGVYITWSTGSTQVATANSISNTPITGLFASTAYTFYIYPYTTVNGVQYPSSAPAYATTSGVSYNNSASATTQTSGPAVTISSMKSPIVTTVGSYYIVTISSNSTITFTATTSASVLIVGAGASSGQGGGGGSPQGGGGGGGGVGTGSLTFVANTQYTISIGNGADQNHNGFGLTGQSTTIVGGTINETATGGLTGSSKNYGGNGNGGNSGTGSGSLIYNTTKTGGTAGTSGAAPGGAGAGTNGSNPVSTTVAGSGGSGVLWNVDNNYYGGGGGGGGNGGGGGSGGNGGGGRGANIGSGYVIATPGIGGTGGGGGGGLTAGGLSYCGEGGQGVVKIALLVIPTINFSLSTTITPKSISGCILWLDPADSTTITTVSTTTNTTLGTFEGSFVSQWTDKTTNNYIFTQATLNNQPLLLNTTVNGQQTLTTFNLNSNRFLTNTTISVGTTYTIFAAAFCPRYAGALVYGSSTTTAFNLFMGCTNVAQYAAYVGNGTAWNDTTATSTVLYNPFAANVGGLIAIAGLTNDGTSTGLIPYFHGTAQTAKNGTTVSFTGLGVPGTSGASGAGSFVLGDIVIYNRVLTQTERQQIEGFLAWKWGTNTYLPAGHPYKSTPP